jgi:hypothetical protein
VPGRAAAMTVAASRGVAWVPPVPQGSRILGMAGLVAPGGAAAPGSAGGDRSAVQPLNARSATHVKSAAARRAAEFLDRSSGRKRIGMMSGSDETSGRCRRGGTCPPDREPDARSLAAGILPESAADQLTRQLETGSTPLTARGAEVLREAERQPAARVQPAPIVQRARASSSASRSAVAWSNRRDTAGLLIPLAPVSRWSATGQRRQPACEEARATSQVVTSGPVWGLTTWCKRNTVGKLHHRRLEGRWRMGIGVGIFLMVLGAILAFAVETDVPGINVNSLGIILLLIGLVAVLYSLLFWSNLTPWGRRRVTARRRLVGEQPVEVVEERPLDDGLP